MNKLKDFLDNFQKDIRPDLDRINAYWDKKALFIHRRALLIGYFLGIMTGLYIGFVIGIVLFK